MVCYLAVPVLLCFFSSLRRCGPLKSEKSEKSLSQVFFVQKCQHMVFNSEDSQPYCVTEAKPNKDMKLRHFKPQSGANSLVSQS